MGATEMTAATIATAARDGDTAKRATMMDESAADIAVILHAIDVNGGDLGMKARTRITAGTLDVTIANMTSATIGATTTTKTTGVGADVHGTTQAIGTRSVGIETIARMIRGSASHIERIDTAIGHDPDHHIGHGDKIDLARTDLLRPSHPIAMAMQRLKSVLPSWPPCLRTPMISRINGCGDWLRWRREMLQISRRKIAEGTSVVTSSLTI
jgi:hypothetical protein